MMPAFLIVAHHAVEDLQHNNGVDKPYFMSKELMYVLGVKNKLQDQPEGRMLVMEDITSCWRLKQNTSMFQIASLNYFAMGRVTNNTVQNWIFFSI